MPKSGNRSKINAGTTKKVTAKGGAPTTTKTGRGAGRVAGAVKQPAKAAAAREAEAAAAREAKAAAAKEAKAAAAKGAKAAAAKEAKAAAAKEAKAAAAKEAKPAAAKEAKPAAAQEALNVDTGKPGGSPTNGAKKGVQTAAGQAAPRVSAAGAPTSNPAIQKVGAGKPVNSLFGMLSCPARVTRDHAPLMKHALYQNQKTSPADQLCSTDRYYILAKCIQVAVYLFLIKVGTAGGPLLKSTADQLIPWVSTTIGDIMKMARKTNFQTVKSTSWFRATEVPGAMNTWLQQFQEFAKNTRLPNAEDAYQVAGATALYVFISQVLKNAQILGKSTVDVIPLAHTLRTQFRSEVKALTRGAGIPDRGEVDARTSDPFPWSILPTGAIGRFVTSRGGDGGGTRQALLDRATTIGVDESIGICNFAKEDLELLKPKDFAKVLKHFKKPAARNQAAILKMIRACSGK